MNEICFASKKEAPLGTSVLPGRAAQQHRAVTAICAHLCLPREWIKQRLRSQAGRPITAGRPCTTCTVQGVRVGIALPVLLITKHNKGYSETASGTPSFPTASRCQFWVRQPLTAATAEMIEDKRHSICAVSKTAINENHKSSVKGGATQWAPLDAVQGLDAEQLEALPHDHGSRLAQQQPRVLLLLSQHLQHHMLVRKRCTALEEFVSCE